MQTFYSNQFLPNISVDCVIFGYENQELKVLVSTLQFKNQMQAIPGGFVFKDECVDDAAKRILKERTGITDLYLSQFKTYGKPDRKNHDLISNLKELHNQLNDINNVTTDDLRWMTERFVSVCYYALVDLNNVKLSTSNTDSHISWFNIKEIPKLIMDHNQMITEALTVMRDDFDHKLTAFALLPEKFTMKELQKLYEVVFGKPFARNNFQKKILDLHILERLEKKFTGAANKAPYLYKFQDGF